MEWTLINCSCTQWGLTEAMKRDKPLIHISISVNQGKITLYKKYVTQEYLGYISTHQQAKQTDALFILYSR